MKIKKVQEQLHMSSHALRYYEKMGMIHPSRDENGYRNYSLEDVELLKKVRFLRELEMPIEDIMQMLNHSKEFQDVLTEHIESLEIQIHSLQAIQEMCLELKDKDVPLLDEIVEQNIQQDNEEKELKTFFQKIVSYMEPMKTVVIGARAVFRDLFFGTVFLNILVVIFVVTGIGIGLPKTIDFMNTQLIHQPTMKTIPNFQPNTIIWLVIILISISCTTFLGILFSIKQKYIELTDQGLYICDKKYQSKYQMFLGIIKNDSRLRNRFYKYQELSEVKIYIKHSTMPTRGGLYRIYLPHFEFHFVDGEIFEIDSGVSASEDSRMAYSILKNKKVNMIVEPLVEEYYHQTDKTGFEFFEEHFGYNTPKKKGK